MVYIVSEEQMSPKMFIWKVERHENPINDRHYQELLWLNPTLSEEIKRYVSEVLFNDFNYICKHELYDNSSIICQEEIEKAKEELLKELNELSELTWDDKKIVIIADKCFTNYKLLILLRKILWKENFNRFVKVVEIDYEKQANNKYLESELWSNHCLYMLWWSLSDTYSIDPSHYDSYLAQIIKDVSDEYYPRYLNKRLIWVCFWQQYLANIIWIANKNSSWIIATIKWPAQLAPSNCTISQLEYVNPIYEKILRWLSDNWNNTHFSSIFTRSWYVDFDLLKSKWNLWIVPLITDDASLWTVWWWSKNWNILWVQFHPEISFQRNKNTLRKELKKILPYIAKNEEERESYLRNFEINDQVKRDIWEAFYVFAMLWYIKDLKRSYLSIKSTFQEEKEIMSIPHNEASARLMKLTSKRVNHYIWDEDTENISLEEKKKWIDSIDKKWRLLLNYMLDWKVNRSIEEISETLWIKSITWLIQEHKEIQESENYIIRDLGAGDWNSIKELQSNLNSDNILIYWTWDYIYFDLYSAIKRTPFSDRLPQDFIVLFTEKVIKEFRSLEWNSTIEKILTALDKVQFHKTDKIHNSSMSWKDTYMFECENEIWLWDDSIKRFDEYLSILEELRIFVKENLYSMFSWFFQKIYISKFNDLHINDEVLSKIDFQYAIRSTSHINWREYMRVISDYFFKSAKVWSIYIDNWVHQSYTRIPRIKELFQVSKDITDWKIKLIYDKNQNYFHSAIITKWIDYNKDFWENHLNEWHIIVSVKEANRSTFFKLEYFLRNFIISNFKNHIVFWDFNKKIDDVLKMIMKVLMNGSKREIPIIILTFINHIAKNYTNWWVRYNQIPMDLLNNYDVDWEKLTDIISKEVYIPEWMNISAIRK